MEWVRMLFTRVGPIRRFWWGIGGAIWLAAVAYGGWTLNEYAATPGPSLANLTHWPAESALKLAADKPTMVVFLHPKCPCSRATLAELERFLLGSQNACQVYLLFVRGVNQGTDWLEGALWDKAGELKGVVRLDDADGIEGGRFGVATSGECLLFDSAGAVLFHGGITMARGHEGDNRGIQTVKNQVAHATIAGSNGFLPVETPIFGCSLRGLCTTPAVKRTETNL